MSSTRTFSRSFSGGEVSPEFWGQVADAKFQTGLAQCRNFIVLPHGPITNRPGTMFVRKAKLGDSGLPVRLIPFEFSSTQTLVLEMGAGYIRFHTLGATVEVSAGVPYEVATPYAQADLFDLHFVQSADVLTIVHPGYPPKELRRYGATNWKLTDISFVPALQAPGTVSAAATTASSPSNLRAYEYVVTALTSSDESFVSAVASCTNNLLQTGAFNVITWGAVAGATRYNVYQRRNGLFGYIGSTDGSAGMSFKDDNITPDLGKTPPNFSNPFAPPGGILSVPVTAGGSGYGSALQGGQISAVTVTAAGLYAGGAVPTATISDPTGSGAVLQVNVSPPVVFGVRVIASVTVLSPGSGYSNPTVVFSDPALQATATASPLVSKLVGLTVSDATGTGAVLTATVVGGAITAINVVDPGSGYTAPTVAISDAAGGSGATLGAPVVGVAGDYPGAVSYFDQRRVFAGTVRKPQNLWMTRTGTESNLQASIPSRDDDAVSFRISARQVNRILHVVPLTNMVLLTGSAEWRVTSVNSDAITPTSVSVKPQSFVGASNVQPVVVNNNILYPAARGGHLREMAYSFQAQGYVTGDLSLRAPHLFDGYQITDMAFAKAPYPILWTVNDQGALLGLTYVPEQQIGAWHRHDTGAGDKFVSVAAVTEGGADYLYTAVRRMVGGALRTYIERMAQRADNWFVDCGLRYQGAAASTVTGLAHLEGRTVAILADGGEHPQRVVTGGQVQLDNPATNVLVGLPIQSDAKTLPPVIEIAGMGQGRPKAVTAVWLRVVSSSGIKVGPDFDSLAPYAQRRNEPLGSPPTPVTDEIKVALPSAWQYGGHVCVRQDAPLPLTITSMTVEFEIGG